jgi:hypothetical protein
MRVVVSAVVGLAVIVAIGAGLLYLDYGTVAPCGILRERIRQQAVREGGQLGGFLATALPDNVLDGLIAAQYGALSPGHCVTLLLNGTPPLAPRGPARPPQS